MVTKYHFFFFLKEILKKLISILRMWICIQISQVFMEEGVYLLGLKVTPVHSRQDTPVKQSQGEITALQLGLITMIAQKLFSLSMYIERYPNSLIYIKIHAMSVLSVLFF